ncbi:MAG: HD domain-containing protein [Bacteroidetes bacterium]|nr:HD domain-containing protein [Bacteroidota bacterium]
MKKKKIFNDPVYGFITIPSELILSLIDHPFFQRLRRIRQLGLSDFVYPGALHTRFHHALGAMHLMSLVLDNLRGRDVPVSDQEYEASQIAILLHDIGHGPFSHSLEFNLLHNVSHEELTKLLFHHLNQQLDGQLTLAEKIFNGQYKRKFFHQLVSSQLDIDRLDYLKRDSFFTGVSEGTIGSDRIIKMLIVKNDQLLVEEKGIYSIENFLNARRLMYWQVYLHKTSLSAEQMLVQIIKRAKDLIQEQTKLVINYPLEPFMTNKIDLNTIRGSHYLEAFARLDDYDIWTAIKSWVRNPDKVLSTLCQLLLDRKLFKIDLTNQKVNKNKKKKLARILKSAFNLDERELSYFLVEGSISNAAYLRKDQSINIFTKEGAIVDIAQASDLPNIKALSKIVKKYYLCWPKSVSL